MRLTRTSAAASSLILLLWIAPALAQWRVVERVDSMTDEKVLMAVYHLDSGQSLGISRAKDKRIWAVLLLDQAGREQFGRRYPMMRVDQLPANDLDKHRTGEAWSRALFKGAPKSAMFVVFHGEGAADRGTLRDMMDGQQLRFRYFVAPDDSTVEIVFPLAGAKEVIARATGVPAEADRDRVTRMEDWDRKLKQAESVCDSQKADARRYVSCRANALDTFSKENPAP